MTLTACDVSTYQVPVNDSYPHRWLIFRVCDGDYPDSKAPANLRWAIAARKAGKLDGFTVYCVYRPGENNAILEHLNTFGVPADCTVMVDVESWNGQITGNRSSEITALVTALTKRQGSQSRVWCYGNRGDLNGLYPKRPKWLGMVVASYGGSKPANPGPGPLVGWQYTNGQYTVAGLPSSTNPFGRCDHNQLYIDATPEDDMTPAQWTWITDELKAMRADVAKVNAFDAAFQKSWYAVVGIDSNLDGKRDYTGSIQRAVQQGIHDTLGSLATSVATAVYAKLPPAAKGGITQADVTTAVKAALQEGTGK